MFLYTTFVVVLLRKVTVTFHLPRYYVSNLGILDQLQNLCLMEQTYSCYQGNSQRKNVSKTLYLDFIPISYK